MWSHYPNKWKKCRLAIVKNSRYNIFMDCVLTFISGDKFAEKPEVGVYLDSLHHISGDKFVFTHDLNPTNRERIAQYNIKIVDVDDIRWIVRDRFRAYAQFLSSCPYHHVLLTDSKDVLFTGNPFDYVREIDQDEFVILVSEGIRHGQSVWNVVDQTGLQRAIRPEAKFEDWPVINGGVQLGTRKAIQRFCDTIYRMMMTVQPGSTEQALINYMYHRHWKDQGEILLADPHKSWFCCTGEPIARGIQGYPIDVHAWKNPNLARPYVIVHQWERIAL